MEPWIQILLAVVVPALAGTGWLAVKHPAVYIPKSKPICRGLFACWIMAVVWMGGGFTTWAMLSRFIPQDQVAGASAVMDKLLLPWWGYVAVLALVIYLSVLRSIATAIEAQQVARAA